MTWNLFGDDDDDEYGYDWTEHIDKAPSTDPTIDHHDWEVQTICDDCGEVAAANGSRSPMPVMPSEHCHCGSSVFLFKVVDTA